MPRIPFPGSFAGKNDENTFVSVLERVSIGAVVIRLPIIMPTIFCQNWNHFVVNSAG